MVKERLNNKPNRYWLLNPDELSFIKKSLLRKGMSEEQADQEMHSLIETVRTNYYQNKNNEGALEAGNKKQGKPLDFKAEFIKLKNSGKNAGYGGTYG